MRRLLTAAGALLVLVAIGASPLVAAASPRVAAAAVAGLPGDVNDFSFRSFDADYSLSRAADRHARLSVTETIVALFPQPDQNRGIVRAIPDEYGGVPLDTRVQSVTDGSGRAVPYDTSRDERFVTLSLGTDAYVHGATTYVIRYTQSDTIRSFADTGSDEFYWDVNGTGWAQPFAEVSARVEIAPDLVPSLTGRQACYQGPENATTWCTGGITGTGVPDPTATPAPAPTGAPAEPAVLTASARDLAAHENLTVAIGFARGTFVEGTPRSPETSRPIDWPPAWTIVLTLGGGGALVPGIVAFVLGRSRRPRAGEIIVPEYAPPLRLGILPAARLLNRAVAARPAELVDLAVRGRVRLLGYPTGHGRDEADYAVQLLDRSGLDAFESRFLDGLFAADAAPGSSRDLLRAGDAGLGKALDGAVSAASAWVDHEFYGPRRSSTAAKVWMGIAIALVVGGLVGAVAGGSVGILLGIAALLPGLIGLILGIVGAVGGRQPTDGAKHLIDHLFGMRMYMQLAEADRMRVLQSVTGAERIDTADGRQIVKLHEQLLPWAILWGIEDSWTAELQTELARVQQEPDWYVGQQAFTVAAFSPVISGMTRGLSAPAPSYSGSGFSSFSGGPSAADSPAAAAAEAAAEAAEPRTRGLGSRRPPAGLGGDAGDAFRVCTAPSGAIPAE
ncbi:DUF2207 domain-containing protein [Pseudolysinimonas sp.]|uniref:DUF2207 domain-containing protein n=1 Tax=Pseudolysinimonas sp. TaxID=2680009 RepID=UPI003F80F867